MTTSPRTSTRHQPTNHSYFNLPPGLPAGSATASWSDEPRTSTRRPTLPRSRSATTFPRGTPFDFRTPHTIVAHRHFQRPGQRPAATTSCCWPGLRPQLGANKQTAAPPPGPQPAARLGPGPAPLADRLTTSLRQSYSATPNGTRASRKTYRRARLQFETQHFPTPQRRTSRHGSSRMTTTHDIFASLLTCCPDLLS